jgi:hypothetical protein
MGQTAMSIYSPGRGRRRVVEKFATRQGLWILGILGVITMGVLMLMLAYMNFDMD